MRWSKLKLIGFFSVAAITPVFAIFAANQAINKSQLELFFEKEGVPTIRDLLTGLSKINKKNRSENSFLLEDSLLIPDSRSLQRSNVSCENPRLLIAISPATITKRLSPVAITPLANGVPSFLGHASKTGEAEMISWNPVDRRYEFSIVKNYIPGKNPIVARANRSTCIACHQNEGPIFSRFPWSETSFNPSIDKIIDSCQKDKNKKEQSPQTQNSGFSFDRIVRRGSRAVQAARVCKDLCGSDLACRKSLLIKTLQLTLIQSPAIPNTPRSQANSKSNNILTKFWPKDGFRHPSSILPDRDPLEDTEAQGTTRLFVDSKDKRIFFPETDLRENPTYDESQSSFPTPLLTEKNFTLSGFAFSGSSSSSSERKESQTLTIKGIRSLADPRTQRPLVSALSNNLDTNTDLFTLLSGVCFGWDTDDIVALKKNADTIISNLEKSQIIEPLLKEWPPDAAQQKNLVSTLLSLEHSNMSREDDSDTIECILRMTNESEHLAEQISAMMDIARKIESSAIKAPLDHKDAVKKFDKYCASCHDGNNFYESGFELPLQDLKQLKEYKNKKVIEFLKDLKMPPRKAGSHPSAEERLEMINVLENYSKN